ncbi:MAG: pyrroline-5-carboxylate reductase [Candidatus Omnitrophota bacterium]|jgi:pyrroline-5-carboxylate reductase
MQRTIGIIGFGNMGSAIGEQLKLKYRFLVFDKDRNKTKDLKDIKTEDNATNLVSRSEVVILAVKPQDFATVLGEIKSSCKEKLIISIAAGITTGYIENKLGKIRIIRVMPNLPAKVGRGMIVLCKGKYSGKQDLDLAQELFGYLGETMLIEEDLMNAATAISGSGPGFFYHLIKDKLINEWEVFANDNFIPKLSQAAQSKGFTPQQAKILASVTTSGSIALLKKTGLSPGILCSRVTSKGGTTEAGLKVLNSIASLPAATQAALRRAEDLSIE